MQTIGRYEIIRELGRGGMAIVYLARDPQISREVAIKVLPRQLQDQPEFQARFQREAEVIASLEHPAIVPIYDVGDEEGQPYIVMRYMSGGSLADRISLAGRLPVPAAYQLLNEISSAITAAHQKGFIHRDLKPGNILFDERGHAFVADFGIAKISSSSTLTGSALIGTPAYMSPEQARGKEALDGRSDVYALGVILFEILTGQLPYEADTPIGMAVAHLNEPVPHILELQADLPSGCEEIIQQALAKERSQRFQTPTDLSEAFKRISGEVRAGAVSYAPPPQPAKLGQIDPAGRKVVSTSKPKESKRAGTSKNLPGWVIVAGVVIVTGILLCGGGLLGYQLLARLPTTPPQILIVTTTPDSGAEVAGQPASSTSAVEIAAPPETTLAPTTAASTPTLPAPPAPAPLPQVASRLIAFAAGTDTQREIYTYDLDTGRQEQITFNDVPDEAPSFSGNNTRLVYASQRAPEGWELYEFDFTARQERQLTHFEGEARFPEYSPLPGSPLIVFEGRGDAPTDRNIWLVDTSTETISQLTLGGADSRPTWSPDGQQVVFGRALRDDTGDGLITTGDWLDIFSINVKSGQEARITNTPDQDDFLFSWSPDGNLILFASVRGDSNGDGRQNLDDTEDLYVIRPDGSGERKLELGGKAAFSPDWSGDGRFIIMTVSISPSSSELWLYDFLNETLERVFAAGEYFHATFGH